jgi:hypothetical protein
VPKLAAKAHGADQLAAGDHRNRHVDLDAGLEQRVDFGPGGSVSVSMTCGSPRRSASMSPISCSG